MFYNIIKHSFFKALSILLIGLVFCNFSINTALAVDYIKHNESVEISNNIVQKLPDRKAIVKIMNTDTHEVQEVTFYLTPDTELNEAWFNNLKSGYVLNSLNISILSEEEIGDIQILWVDTIFDVGNFVISLAEYNANPSFWNGFWVVMDGASVVFPGIPSISGVKRMMQSSPTLHESLKYGVRRYGTLRNISIPSDWERHHIFEKRFAARLSTTENSMLAIPLPGSEHSKVTTKMRAKIPYGSNYYDYSPSDILKAHQDTYKELWYETGNSLWEFLYEFSKTGQHTAN
ncbi:MAG: hypothetical protein PHO25_09545 [Syntrophomonadaceae bacterium]|nr:hypothetical protein [Syntrophomonadaceae bacterium]